jgi:hypothetical protein
MEINKIQQNYGHRRASLKKAKQQSFTGSPTAVLPKIGEQITESLAGRKAIERMKNFEWLRGEIGGILITAFGTGLVAPIFIGSNPFVKPPKGATPEEKQEVKNTKWYTAMRQPISAALAILFQVSVLKPIDKVLDQVFNVPKHSAKLDLYSDQSVINGESYRKTLVKNEFKKQSKFKPSIFRVFKDGWSKTMEARKAYNSDFKKAVDALGDKQIATVTADLMNTGSPNVHSTGVIHVGSRKIDAPVMAKLVNDQIDDYISKAEKLQIKKRGLLYYTERARLLMENEAHLREIFKDIPEKDQDVTAFVKDLIAKEQNPEVKTQILEDILKKPEDIRANRMKRTLERIDSIKKMCGNKYEPNTYLRAMSEKNAEIDRIITDLGLHRIKDTEKATDKTVKDAINKVIKTCHFDQENGLLQSILHDTDTFNPDINKVVKKVNTDIAKAYKKLIEHNYKSTNQLTKIAIGACITLPITCTALNWIYPRFMELFFPKLAGVKKDNAEAKVEGGDK